MRFILCLLVYDSVANVYFYASSSPLSYASFSPLSYASFSPLSYALFSPLSSHYLYVSFSPLSSRMTISPRRPLRGHGFFVQRINQSPGQSAEPRGLEARLTYSLSFTFMPDASFSPLSSHSVPLLYMCRFLRQSISRPPPTTLATTWLFQCPVNLAKSGGPRELTSRSEQIPRPGNSQNQV